MINLIPTSAKRIVIKEYWTRVISVWFVVWSVALLVSGFILVPAFFLIYSQALVYEQSAEYASQKIASYESVSEALVQSSQQAKIIIDSSNLEPVSVYLSLFESLLGSDIELSGLTVQRDEAGIAPVSLIGVATDRQSLADFRDRLLNDPKITEVDLPISNLAKDKDIYFNITVTINNVSS